MRIVILLAFLFFVLQSGFAQQETLFEDWEVIGAFGGPFVEIGAVKGEVSGNVGGGGALVLDDFFIGGYGLGSKGPRTMVTDTSVFEDPLNYRIRFKHGGLWFGYTYKGSKLAHLYSSLRMGWGTARLDDVPNAPSYSDRTFVLTPEVGVELNVFKFFRVGFTAGYRWVNGVNQLPGLKNRDFSSPVGVITFRFGGFGNYSEDWNWDWD